MLHTVSFRLAVGFCFVICGAAACAGQTYTPPPPPLSTLPPCPTGKAAKKKAKIECDPTNVPSSHPDAPKIEAPAAGSVEQKFLYPGEQPAGPAKAFPFPGDPTGPTAPAGQREPTGNNPDTYAADPNVAHDAAAEKRAAGTPAAKSFPYPGDPAPADAPGQPQPSSSSTSSSSSSSDDATPAVKGATKSAVPDDDDDHDEKPKLTDKGSEGKRSRKTEKPQSDTDRVDEDLSIAKFYGQSGNAMGAYLRARDAVKIEPDYPEAHFVLGEAAKRLNKRDEAKTEFAAYLKLAPLGPNAKAAERALENLP